MGRLIKQINFPADLRKFKKEDLVQISEELREELIDVVSETEESEVDLEHFVEKRNALRLLLNALLNVSVENSENQMLICKKGIHMLHRLLVDPTNSERDEEAYAEGILVNLKRCPSNRRA